MRRALLVFLVPPLFFACSSLPPVSGSREQAEPAGSIGDVIPFWQPLNTGKTPGTGPEIGYFAGKIRNPKLEFRALRADLSDPELEIVVSGSALSVHVSSFVRDTGAAAGINANPFDPVSGKEREKRTIVGITVSDGVLVSPPDPAYDALVFYRSRRAAIVRQSEIRETEGIENAVGGFFIVLENGSLPTRLTETAGSGAPRHPRSAVGLSDEGRILYILAVDGRRPGSAGATEAELGLLLRRLGASEGLNLDGGGSTALALRYPDGKVRTVNTPVHNRIPGLERGVASCLGLKSKEAVPKTEVSEQSIR
ncbi:MAG: phosphodiester glycosidase family protein [Treponema sp.]|nr:phosphodiester glycosidase family protein [Treponema sp.]